MKFTIKRLMFYVFLVALFLVTFGVPVYEKANKLFGDKSSISGEGWLFKYAAVEADFLLANIGDDEWLHIIGGVDFPRVQISQLVGIVFCIVLVIVGFWITRTKGMKFTIKRMIFLVLLVALFLVTFGVPRYRVSDLMPMYRPNTTIDFSAKKVSGEGLLFEYGLWKDSRAKVVQLQVVNSGDKWHYFLVGVGYPKVRISQLIGIVFCIVLVIVGFWITRNKPSETGQQ